MTTVALSFLTGVLIANATPHFVKGITKEHFPTVFGSGPLVNLVCGWAMYVIAALVAAAADITAHLVPAGTAAALGVLAMGVFHATVGAFGKGRTTSPQPEPTPAATSTEP